MAVSFTDRHYTKFFLSPAASGESSVRRNCLSER
jgi:hypothetical protein